MTRGKGLFLCSEERIKPIRFVRGQTGTAAAAKKGIFARMTMAVMMMLMMLMVVVMSMMVMMMMVPMRMRIGIAIMIMA